MTCQNYVSVHLLTVAGRGSDLAVLQVGDAEKFPQAVDFESLDPFFRVSMQDPCFTAIEEHGGDKRLLKLEFACEANRVASPDPGQSGHCCIC